MAQQVSHLFIEAKPPVILCLIDGSNSVKVYGLIMKTQPLYFTSTLPALLHKMVSFGVDPGTLLCHQTGHFTSGSDSYVPWMAAPTVNILSWV